MRSGIHLTDVRLTTHPSCRDGLIGWVAVTLNGGLRVDGIALRRSAAGNLILSFPMRTDGHGRRHAIVRPLDDDTRRNFEAQVFRALGMEEIVR